MKQIVIVLASLVIILFLVGALLPTTPIAGKRGDAKDSVWAVTEIQAEDQERTARNFKVLAIADPAPSFKESQERKNLIRRLTRFNVPNKISYIYLINFGRVMSFYTIKGKVSSVNSMLTCTEQIVFDGRLDHSAQTVPSPDLDGSYGSNGDAIFFFTTEDVYVEWNGDYMLCDQPLQMATQPELVYVVDKTEN